jgi:hypothetical protein
VILYPSVSERVDRLHFEVIPAHYITIMYQVSSQDGTACLQREVLRRP